MSERSPDFRDLVGEELSADDEARLRRVHDLLLSTGPPPDLPPALQEPPSPPAATVLTFPRRRSTWLAGIAAAAALALVGFGAGYLVGDRGEPVEFTVAMHGTAASASLVVYEQDAAGNWPMLLKVKGLPAGETYELWLTRNGERAEPCGAFTVGQAETSVPLNAPYKLKEFDGWVVVESGSTSPVLTT
ncbi:MAG TPA: anti-sigma factor [Gaiellaceae bacterium]|nr:anti-sigma factor [Gaiellaceae bacterium]